MSGPGAVPADWRGLWQRLALERADGSGDTQSQVTWLQTATLYADLRIPGERPDFAGVVGFAELTRPQAAFLASQEGFAGALHGEGARAHWQRRIDFAPLAGPPDEGYLHRERRMMVETGVHVPYVEHWWQADPDAALDTEIIVDAPRTVMVRAGEHFMFAQDRRPAPPPPGTLAAAVAAAAPGAALAALLDCEISLGTRTADGWRITCSTLPWREGGLADVARSVQSHRQASD